jgi:hypothetical protein
MPRDSKNKLPEDRSKSDATEGDQLKERGALRHAVALALSVGLSHVMKKLFQLNLIDEETYKTFLDSPRKPEV